MAEAVRKAPAKAVAKENVLPPVRVTYYKRMKCRKVYPLHIRWKPAERGVAGKPLTLRPIVGGALVTPVEQTLNPGDPEDQATFYVTPMAKGKLGRAMLEVLTQGRKVQEIPMPAKVVSQCWTWIFLCLAILVPWLLLHYCKYSPIQDGDLKYGETLENRILNKVVPEIPAPVKDLLPTDWFKNTAKETGKSYEALVALCQDLDSPIPFYTAACFLGLALLSAFWHLDWRKRRWSEPIIVPLPRQEGES